MLMIIDGNNHCLRNALGLYNPYAPGLQTSDGRDTGMLLGSINAFIALVKRLNPDRVVFAFDHGRSEYRLGIRETYKSNRTSSNDPVDNFNLKSQFAQFQAFLDIIGVLWYREKGVEADDLIATLAIQAKEEVIIVSADHDLLQLVSYTVKVLKPSIGKNSEVLYDPEKVYEKYSLKPRQLPELWALTGDSGDGIDGIPKVGPVTALKMLKEFGKLSTVITHHPKCRGYEELVSDNYDMIVLNGALGARYIPQNVDYSFDKPYPSSLRAFLKEFEINSLLIKFDKKTLWGE